MSKYNTFLIFICFFMPFSVNAKNKLLLPVSASHHQITLETVHVSGVSNQQSDTLTYEHEPPYFVFSDPDFQKSYEATRFIPEGQCAVRKLLSGFYNYDSLDSKSKSVQFIVWSDDNGMPGDRLYTKEMDVEIAPLTSSWIEVSLDDYLLIVRDAFWVGHVEMSDGPPSSLVDTVVTPGVNFYSQNGDVWLEDQFDYLHKAVVEYLDSEPEIEVYPDTLRFAVGLQTSHRQARSIDSDLLRSRYQYVNDPIPSLQHYAADGELDTLKNDYTRPYGHFNTSYQVEYEATRLIPARTCTLKQIIAAFTNSESQSMEKNVRFYIWDDDNGLPGEIIFETERGVRVGSQRSEWITTPIDGDNVIFNSAFWVGHYETTAGWPTSQFDTLETPGANVYSDDGLTWNEDNLDYLHMVTVEYGEIVPGEGDKTVFLVKNIGDEELHVTRMYSEENWFVDASPDLFHLSPGDSQIVIATANTYELDAGAYTGILNIDSNDPDTPVYDEPMRFDIREGTQPEPDIDVTPDTISCSLETGDQVEERLTITNSGNAVLNVSTIVSEADFVVSIEPKTVSIPSGQNAEILIRISAEARPAGDYAGLLHVLSNDPDRPDCVVEVKLNVFDIPDIDVRPDSLHLSLPVDTKDSTRFTLKNRGSGKLTIQSIVSDAVWIDAIVPDSAEIAPGDSQLVRVTINSAGVDAGWYENAIEIRSNDPDTPVLALPVSVEIIAFPQIIVSPDTLVFSAEKGDSDTAGFVIRNTGDVILNVAKIHSEASWFVSILPDSFTVAPGDSQSVQFVVSAIELEAGVYEEVISILSDDPERPELSLLASFEVSAFPEIRVVPDTLVFRAEKGESDTAGFVIRNTGDAGLNVLKLGSDAIWIASIVPDSCTVAPGDSQSVQVMVSASGLEAGFYEDSLSILSDDPNSPEMVVLLILEVSGSPDITVTPDTLMFEYNGNDGPGGNQMMNSLTEQLLLRNTGDAMLSIYSIFADVPWVVSLSDSSAGIATDDSLAVQVDVDAENLTSGIYNGMIHILSNDPDTPDYPVYLILTIIVTGVGEEEYSAKPERFGLSGNYPNPFNPETMIEYQISERAFVSIRIYNAVGQEVRMLINEEKDAGRYSVVWRATSDHGMQLASGLYFVQMRSSGHVFTRKMLLLE